MTVILTLVMTIHSWHTFGSRSFVVISISAPPGHPKQMRQLCSRGSSSATRGCCRPFTSSTLYTRHSSSGSIAMSGAAASAVQTHAASGLLHGDTFFLDNFALRQWDDPNYSGTRIQFDKAEFVARVHQLFQQGGGSLVEGYAPFCKHVFVPNFVGAQVGALEVTAANRHLLRSAYTRRRPEELAVLTRWLPEAAVQPVPQATHLDLILYSREQLIKEYRDMPSKTAAAAAGSGDPAAAADPEQLLPNVPWGIISIKAQDESYETPMQPITMMRNALGREEGGSGVTLSRDAYEASVLYWQSHAAIVAGEEPSGE